MIKFIITKIGCQCILNKKNLNLNLFFFFCKFKPISSTARSSASTLASQCAKRTPARITNTNASSNNNNSNNNLNQASELLMIAAAAASSNSPMQSGTNSHSGSLGASISDLSSDAHSELSDHNNTSFKNNQADLTTVSSGNRKSSIPTLPKSFSSNTAGLVAGSNSGTSTPTKGGSSSRLPVPKK